MLFTSAATVEPLGMDTSILRTVSNVPTELLQRTLNLGPKKCPLYSRARVGIALQPIVETLYEKLRSANDKDRYIYFVVFLCVSV